MDIWLKVVFTHVWKFFLEKVLKDCNNCWIKELSISLSILLYILLKNTKVFFILEFNEGIVIGELNLNISNSFFELLNNLIPVITFLLWCEETSNYCLLFTLL